MSAITPEQRAIEYQEVEKLLERRSPDREPGIWTMEQRARILGWSFPDQGEGTNAHSSFRESAEADASR